MSEVLDDDSLSQFKRAVEAVTTKKMSIRKAASAFGVSKSALQRRTTGQVAVNAKYARTKRGQCFTTAELGLFVCRVVEESPYKREIPASFPSYLWLAKFIKSNSKHFSRRKAQNLETCRTIAATEENVRSHYCNLKTAIESCGDFPPSCIWNLDETGMCGQGSRNAKVVLASKGKRANVQQSDSRDSVSALVHTRGAMEGVIFAASERSFLVTALFVKYFKWFVNMIPPAGPVLVVMDGYKAHFTATTLACARSQGIILYAIPAHTSHFLQPLDVTVFRHFKRELDNEIDSFQKQTHMMVDKSNLAEIGSRGLQKALT
ncbi:hypothetical protein PR003_g5306 [Phytophthora rubi]|uniref:DDE-1 domain-containing protein n=1 Tax=Phytophthora rubi TaxID=129364 RepID=A0A6A4FJU1_9STRA|nr:hypothetical protein PR003_g5306 [Phytophthora rubi]